MDTSKTYSGLTSALADYFGRNRGEVAQTLTEFANECKALSDADKAEFKTMLQGVGYKFSA